MDALEEIKARLNIEDVIGEYVQLKRAGRNWKGLSPFGNEKTPSFMVSPDKQIWHDFSSGKGGNMFSFIMEVEGLDFKGALELLARKAGVDLEQFRTGSKRGGPDKERLIALLELATTFYQVQFSKNQTALKYVLQKRAFTKETALAWRIGYSPNTGDALAKYALSKGYTEQELKQAGLIAQRYRGLGDMFRGRLMIPLQDPQGRVIGFTARLLEDDPNAPKYINTPQTVLYDKSRHIYGLHAAKTTIRQTKFVVLVEGNLDVIASHQAGVTNVVATAGTALTEPHLKALSRFTGDIRLCFDADKAGISATERAIPIASRVKVSLSIITLPSGKDPDELVRQSVEAWEQAIADYTYALDWLIERYRTLLDINSAQGKREFTDVLLPVVKSLEDPVERDHYLTQVSQIIGVSKEALDQKFTASTEGPSKRRVKTTQAELDAHKIESQRAQDNFLSLMLMRPSLREFLEIVTPDMMVTPSGQVLTAFLLVNPEFHGRMEHPNDLVTALTPYATDETSVQTLIDYVKIESLLYEELYQSLELNELHYEAARLQARLIAQFVKTKKQVIAEQLETASEADTRQLLEQVKQYDQLLNQVKGAPRGET